MFSFLAKALFAGATVALVTVIARRHPGWGGLLAALPLTSILALSLLWIETGDRNRVADLSRSILISSCRRFPCSSFFLPFCGRGRRSGSQWRCVSSARLPCTLLPSGRFRGWG
jgi:hypothetical protein